jgi:hypothetical protein
MKTIALGAALALLSRVRHGPRGRGSGRRHQFSGAEGLSAASCVKPAPLPKQPVTTIAAEIERYNVLIANYNKAGKAYVTCVNEYVGNANRDMDIIRQKKPRRDRRSQPAVSKPHVSSTMSKVKASTPGSLTGAGFANGQLPDRVRRAARCDSSNILAVQLLAGKIHLGHQPVIGIDHIEMDVRRPQRA